MITFTDSELQEIKDSLLLEATELERYLHWIDDRPMLPEREVAIQRIKDQARSKRQIALRIMEALK